ncbi:calcium-dependent mitochondrial ATP-magnesium/phosphate carrier protein 1-like [Impatiens glandulifera]|uniref:calcium-dependent mitochondrial ATP-magnesium/phosphate carrier protein 1-like n=1 Tax=Impatiens glandulifera TaxID=253017 RepID=UPI001FB121EC|nr:calcium-dependent mitochondrial ATP-magnesium/phosphate carrier protein 1-like [Impatiens glandulifera]
MVNANDPLDSLFGSSLHGFKDAMCSLESGVKHLQNDIGQFWSDSKYGSIKSNSKIDNEWSFLGLHKRQLFCNGDSGGKESKGEVRDDIKTCSNCGQSSFKQSFSLNVLFKTFPNDSCSLCSYGHQRKQSISFETKECLHLYKTTHQLENVKTEEKKKFSIQIFTGLVCEQLMQNLQKFELGIQEFCNNGKRTKVNRSLRNSMFARVMGDSEGSGRGASQEVKNELIGQSVKDPDKKMLLLVHDFFRYTESEGRKFFEELDRDGDGRVTLKDLEVAMRKRKLPLSYAHELMTRTRSNLFSKSFGWKQFLPIMEHKESTILRVYISFLSSKSAPIQKSEMLTSLEDAGFPANEDITIALQRLMNAGAEEHVSYGHFRNYMLLLPSYTGEKHCREDKLSSSSLRLPATSLLKSAFAGGISCAFSCALMHPIDTIKTQVQASTTLSFPEVISMLPQIGFRGLYKGSIPAIVGQFSSHGLRTGIFEATKIVLGNVSPSLTEMQVQSVASFCGTFIGTAMRIPCEVLKQRLQVGHFNNVWEGIVGIWSQEGLNGFFRGTGATLVRELPFYVAGMGLYAQSKKATQHILGRELEAWESMAVGAISGGLTAIMTTPIDVMKTRMMTAPAGQPISATIVFISILQQEGILGFYKGAIPRFFWVAPLGALNFAGYEIVNTAIQSKPRLKAN